MSALPKAINQHNPYKNLSAFFSPRSRYPQHPHGTAGDSQIAKSVLNKRALSTTQQEAGVTILTLMRCLRKGVGKMELKDNWKGTPFSPAVRFPWLTEDSAYSPRINRVRQSDDVDKPVQSVQWGRVKVEADLPPHPRWTQKASKTHM